jgi:DNA-binding transcriptional MocR family regulator
MSLWIPNLADRSGPVYRVIVEALAEDISSGRLPAGSRLPAHRDLAWRLDVTVGTIARAYAEAARQGLVAGEVGRGTFVLSPTAEEARPVHAYFTEKHFETEAVIDMAINRPSGDNCVAAVAAAFRRLADNPNLERLLGYQLETPPLRYRAAGAAWVAREGVQATPDQVVMTVGGQQSIITVLGAVTRPGDTIFAEELTYPGLKVSASLLDRSVEGIAMDDDGLVPEACEHALQTRTGRVIYCMPTNQNPTVRTMSLERRQAIVAVARHYDAIIVEDGIYASLADSPPPPLCSLAPERSIYLTALSKSVAPGLRIGFAVAPKHVTARIAANVSASTLMVPGPLAEVAAMLIEDGTAAAANDAQKAEAKERMRIAGEILGERFCPPTPAFNLWLHLPPPWRADAFAAETYRRGVVVSPAGSFATTRKVPEAIRVSLSAPHNHDDLRRGLHIIGQLLKGSPNSMGMRV